MVVSTWASSAKVPACHHPWLVGTWLQGQGSHPSSSKGLSGLAQNHLNLLPVHGGQPNTEAEDTLSWPKAPQPQGVLATAVPGAAGLPYLAWKC